MQDYVPYNFSRKKQRGGAKRIGAILLTVIFVVFVLVFVFSIVLKPNTNKYFDEISFYFVYTNKNSKQSVLNAESEYIKSLGGSGEIFCYNDQYYLIANVYFSSSDANEIKMNIQPNFADAGILKITKKLSKSQKRALKENKTSLEFFMFMYGLLNSIQNSSMKYIAGSLSESALCREIMSKKLELEGLTNNHKQYDDELSKQILSVENVFLLHLNKFFDEFFITNKKQSVLAQLVVSLAFAQCDLYDNL